MNIDIDHVIYVGNDINDLHCMQAVGCGIVVADAHADLMPYAKIVLEKKGGHGAVRELCDLLITIIRKVDTSLI
jgi:YrbI family 3-deoxy-D-manno-octulosonate 8-phosphate phosphatase